jgi:hypothetical protein
MIDQVINVSPIDVAISKLRKVEEKPDIKITQDFTVAVRAYINNLLASDDQCREQFTKWIGQKKLMTEALHNDRGMSETGEFKSCINMPELLGLYVLKQFPEITENKKNMYKFMKAFPEFTVPKAAFKTKYDAR